MVARNGKRTDVALGQVARCAELDTSRHERLDGSEQLMTVLAEFDAQAGSTLAFRCRVGERDRRKLKASAGEDDAAAVLCCEDGLVARGERCESYAVVDIPLPERRRELSARNQIKVRLTAEGQRCRIEGDSLHPVKEHSFRLVQTCKVLLRLVLPAPPKFVEER